jgi:hypothetical protein
MCFYVILHGDAAHVTDEQGTIVRRTNVSCNATALSGYHLNLPSLAVPDLRCPVTVWRTVTNVGDVDSVYRAAVQSPAGVSMEVEPPVLVFDAANRVRTFKVKMSPAWKMQGTTRLAASLGVLTGRL